MDPYINDGFVELATPGLGAAVTSITLKTGHGARLTDLMAKGPFTLTFYTSSLGNVGKAFHAGKAKRVRVTAITGDVLTVTDGAEGTSTAAIADADVGMFGLTKGFIDGLLSHARSGGDWLFYLGNYTTPLGPEIAGVISWQHIALAPIGSGAGQNPFGKIITLFGYGLNEGWVWTNGAAGAPSTNDRFLLKLNSYTGEYANVSLNDANFIDGVRLIATPQGSSAGGYIWRQLP